MRTATRTTYDADARAVEVDKGTTNAAGGNFTALETSTTGYDPNGSKIQETMFNGTTNSGANPA